MDYALLDEIIIGRVEPHIYAFSTNTIPNYLKVGDTYRPVNIRLKEWEVHYPTLEKKFDAIAKIDDVFFRDFSVHRFLETEKGKIRLLFSDIPDGVYYSKEFFRDVSVADLEEAIDDIKKDFSEKTQKYSFYNAETLKPEDMVFQRTEDYPLRPNQEKTVKAFESALEKGHHNLLMYAVMRFGKSFTAMCCAAKRGAKLVVVVSAKADVLSEWKKTVESHVMFADYDFVSAKNLSRNNHLITEKLSSGKKVVVFLTLQDLKGDKIKDKHQEVFGQDIDLLLVDETHFGARAEKYGEVLKDAAKYVPDAKNKKYDDDFVEASEADAKIKELKAKNTIHLSGTPYRILMGSEFSKEDIIAFYQFTDIVNDQKQWDKEHILDDDYKEWDNPYYGFPQMVRFAFAPNESARKKLESLRKSGSTFAFSALFMPKSIKKNDDGLHKQFQNEEEIMDLFSVIDGSKEDDCLLGFLDYDKIKEGKMCRHIVVVLPYCASCDALELLIKNNKERFKNLGEYEIINISGVDNPDKYKTPEDVKRAIANFESEGRKTITLTVNRMLTGSTVREWDTMLFFKDTASPQEYDQAVFRLQNQYVTTYTDADGNTIKFNMKPQTLLVDFDPNRMFVMQERKSKIYNANIETGGNTELEKRIRQELEISPIITINKDKIVKVVATDILEAVSNYHKDKGIKDEAVDTPVDLTVLDDSLIRSAIERENEIGSKKGLSSTAYEKEDDKENGEIDIPDSFVNKDNPDVPIETESVSLSERKKIEQSLSKKIQSYYTRILLFAFITKDTVISLADIIAKSKAEENARIIKNLGLNVDVLSALNRRTNKFVLSDLDYKILNLNKLSKDDALSPEEKASVAINKFGKLGEASVITPSNICDDMVNLIPDETFMALPQTNGKFLDIAGTAGEYAEALCKKMRALGIEEDVVRNSIYTVPKSSVCYELTRKLYDMLGLNVVNIAKEFTATDLLNIKKGKENIDYGRIKALLTQNKPFDTIRLTNTLSEGEKDMIKFEAVVGNPPYQGTADDTSEPAIYNYFMDVSYRLSDISCMITPAKFLFNAGKTSKNWNKKMLNDEHLKVSFYEPNNTKVFPETGAKGGIVITYRDINQNFGKIGTFTAYSELNAILHKVVNDKFESIAPLIFAPESYKLSKRLHKEHPEIASRLSPGHVYDVTTNIFTKLRDVLYDERPNDGKDYIKLIGKTGTQRLYKWLRRDYLNHHDNLDCYKVIIPKANGSGAVGEVLSTPLIGEPLIGHTQTFISIGAFDTLSEAEAVFKYVKTKFARALLGTLKVTQDNKKSSWQNVPLQDFTDKSDIDWSKSVAEIDRQLYKKYNLDESEIAFIESMIKPME